MINKYLSLVLIICILIFYVQYYSKYNREYTILQLYLDKVDINHLYEKNPIVIYDRVINPQHLLKTLFAYSYAYHATYNIKGSNYVHTNTSKYLLLYSPKDSNINVNILNPKYNGILKSEKRQRLITSKVEFTNLNDAQYVTIKLKQNQILILPSFWSFHSYNDLTCIELHDVFSLVYFACYRMLK